MNGGMSAIGTKRTIQLRGRLSAFGPKRTNRILGSVCPLMTQSGPKADIMQLSTLGYERAV
jgi:hypothetical protein